jgi:hypothetical protein
VLNDLLHDQDREAAIAAFARHLHGTGLLFLDVRDMDGTRQRYARGLTTQRTVSLDGGDLTFRTAGTFEDGFRHVRERHEHHRRDGSADTASYEMTMRPWDSGELHARLGCAGLTITSLRHGADRPASDHLIGIAAPAKASRSL